MININIIDVSNESPDTLRRIAAYLMDTAEQRVPVVAIDMGKPGSDATAVTVVKNNEVEAVTHIPTPPVSQVKSPNPAAVPPATPTFSPSGVELDTRGFPWDARIHSASKQKIADGTWRYRRNSDEKVVEFVEGELRKTMSAPAAPVEPVAAVVVPPVPSAETPAGAVPPVPPVAPAAADPGIAGFPALMEYITSLTTTEKITIAKVMDIVKEQGLPHVGALAQRTDLIPVVRQKIGELVA